ncbi:MAG: hypothetical protein COV75_00480 [Candidatus Omnitrophica bacterium CG11_big_fil_rev_8_21_14_0_20_63_9]|nr:MAG: hypothetical protein COV75_00480 [Candidatus Omnitrophica bacterium CG11_big_fil_rev_8_21_14_0_20_63_9]
MAMDTQADVATAGLGPHPVRPFRFYTSLILQESTGLRAATLAVLLKLLRTVPESCIYHHTHFFLLQHNYLIPEPTNDFAYWIAEVLGEEGLGELLASMDILEHRTLASLREALIETIDRYVQEHPTARLRFVGEGEEFFFIKAVHVIVPTRFQASTLEEFAYALEHVSPASLYFHMFDARLRVGERANDFAVWLSQQLGLAELGESVAGLDPYGHTLEALRAILLGLVREELRRTESAHA